jgi:hypothetical protein
MKCGPSCEIAANYPSALELHRILQRLFDFFESVETHVAATRPSRSRAAPGASLGGPSSPISARTPAPTGCWRRGTDYIWVFLGHGVVLGTRRRASVRALSVAIPQRLPNGANNRADRHVRTRLRRRLNGQIWRPSLNPGFLSKSAGWPRECRIR